MDVSFVRVAELDPDVSRGAYTVPPEGVVGGVEEEVASPDVSDQVARLSAVEQIEQSVLVRECQPPNRGELVGPVDCGLIAQGWWGVG
jgi:hypothetical protein